ncbi:MAG: threonine/serine ThrE exporter family protein [Nocardioides sp.]
MPPEESTDRTLNLTLDFCLRVGEMLLSSGAGAADVLVTMQALARHFGLNHPEIDVTFTSLSMSSQSHPEDPPVVAIRQVKQRDIDYEDLTQVDHLVRHVLADQIDLSEARRWLARIVSSGHHTPRGAITVAWGLMCAAVALQLGGGATVVAIAFVSAVCIDRMQLVMARRRLPFFYQQVAGGAVATLLAVAVDGAGLAIDTSLVVTANIVMLLAGIGFMGALQDALTGFYITANARLLEAVLATAGIIAGVSVGLSVADLVGVDVGPLVPGRTGWEGVTVTAVGSALAAGAFALASYAPRRVLLPIAAIAGVAMVIFQAFETQGFGRPWAAGVAAFFVGLVSYAVAGRVGVPPLVVVVSAVIPMLPGLSIYRGLSLLADGGSFVSPGLLAMITAASVAISLAAGVILGEYVAQPVKREARRLENRLSGPRLVGASRVRSRRRRRTTADPPS